MKGVPVDICRGELPVVVFGELLFYGWDVFGEGKEDILILLVNLLEVRYEVSDIASDSCFVPESDVNTNFHSCCVSIFIIP